ncbi:DUF1488 family protein [Rheinheimera aquimaris]|uniref:DUF1488 family protein n=1 Tax=Rheinheimera aquimaris TaxID=412437 RepID=UPI003A979F12
MNQQIIFNNDFDYCPQKQAVRFTCLVSGLKVSCYIKVDTDHSAAALQQIKQDAFIWEDRVELAIDADEINSDGEIWL